MSRTRRSIAGSRLVAAIAAMTVCLGVSAAWADVSTSTSGDSSSLKFEAFLPATDYSSSGTVVPREGIGVDPALGVAVATDGSGSIWTISTQKPWKPVQHVTTPVGGHGVLDAGRHVVYIGESLSDKCDGAGAAVNPTCNTALVPGGAPAAPAQAPVGAPPPVVPRIETVRLPDMSTSTYTLPTSATGASVVAMAPFALGDQHVLYVLVSRTYDTAALGVSKGFVHQTMLYELDADKLLAGSAAGDPLVWAHDVSTCPAFVGAPFDYLGIDPSGRFAYFDCRGILVANTATFTPGGAVVVDFPQPLPTAAQEAAGAFKTSFYPAGAPSKQEISAGDPAAGLLIQAVADGAHDKLYVFDAIHRAWTGSVPVNDIGINLWGIAVDATNGEAYTVGDQAAIAASQVTALPVRLGNTPSLGDIAASAGSGPPLFDPATGQLFMFGTVWTHKDRSQVKGQVAAVYQDEDRFTPFDATPPDPDAQTHNVPITPDTPVDYTAEASGYGLRAVQVGGLRSTEASRENAVNLSNPAFTIDTDCAFAKAPCGGVVPSEYDGTRALTFAASDVSTENSGVTGDATPYELDTSSAAQFTSLNSPSGLLAGAASKAGQGPPPVPDLPAPPDQVSQRVAPASCEDFSDKRQSSQQAEATAECDKNGRQGAAAAVAPGAIAGSPVQVGYATSYVVKASQSQAGAAVDVTSEAHGIVVSVPGGPTARIGSVVTRATATAVGYPKTATGTFSRKISEVTVLDPAGNEVFSCGFQSSPSCDPRQITDAFNKQSPFPVEFLTPEPDDTYGRTPPVAGVETVNGSPGGAKAKVLKSDYAYLNDENVNGDASHEIPGLQIVMVNDDQQPSRLVFEFAAVHAEAKQQIGVLPPAPPVLPAPTLQLNLVDGSTPPVPLAGGSFTLQGPDGVQPRTCTTAADGVGNCSFTDLAPGDYTIHEATPPPGFAAATDYPISMDAGQAYSATFVNLAAIGSVHVALTAAGDTPTPLSGGVFAMYGGTSILGEPLATCTTDSSGSCGFDRVPLGDYTMHEVSAPEGYLVSDDVPFSLTEPGQDETLAFVDGTPGVAAVPPTIIPGKPAVPPHTEVLHIPGTGGGPQQTQPAMQPAAYQTSLPPPVVATKSTLGSPPVVLGGGAGAALSRVTTQLARLLTHSPRQALLLLFLWMVLGLPVYLLVRRRQFIVATERS